MHAIDLIHREQLEETVLDHLLAAALTFFGRLENQLYGAGEITGFGKVFGRAEQHRGVAVMAAGMHFSVILGAMLGRAFFLDRQRIHVGAQADGRTVAAIALDACHHTRTAEPPVYFKPHLRQPFRHEIRGFELLETKLRIGVDMAPPAGQFGVKIGDTIDDRHEVAPCGRE